MLAPLPTAQKLEITVCHMAQQTELKRGSTSDFCHRLGQCIKRKVSPSVKHASRIICPGLSMLPAGLLKIWSRYYHGGTF